MDKCYFLQILNIFSYSFLFRYFNNALQTFKFSDRSTIKKNNILKGKNKNKDKNNHPG